jgi:hypothetical protein
VTDHYAIVQRNVMGTWSVTLYRPAYMGANTYLPAGRGVIRTAAWILDAEAWLNERGFTVAAWKEGLPGDWRARLTEIRR